METMHANPQQRLDMEDEIMDHEWLCLHGKNGSRSTCHPGRLTGPLGPPTRSSGFRRSYIREEVGWNLGIDPTLTCLGSRKEDEEEEEEEHLQKLKREEELRREQEKAIKHHEQQKRQREELDNAEAEAKAKQRQVNKRIKTNGAGFVCRVCAGSFNTRNQLFSHIKKAKHWVPTNGLILGTSSS
ncbi:hypothetical protein B0T13DRAFT_444308 [Neurospora crassa]|nr:hypothetical protein B0T13DRAFT_444308 [Neurospora crassa]